MQTFGVVDFGAHQVLQAERIDQQGDAIGLHGEIVVALVGEEATVKRFFASVRLMRRPAGCARATAGSS